MSKKYLLDPFKLPIYSQTLIESSAGTGKTYVLIILYLRLLLGLTAKNELYKCCFSVNNILLITFNKKLSEILKKKIKKLIIKLKTACLSHKKSKNKIIIKFLTKIKNRFKAFLLLDTAEKNFEKASIFNINSFCKNILYKYQSFEYLFKYKLLYPENNFFSKIIKDYWNKTLESIKDHNLTKILLKFWPTEQYFIKYFEPLLKNICLKNKKIYQSTVEKIFKKNIKIIEKIKSIINLLHVDNLFITINFLKLNKKKFNLKYINKIFSIISIWSKSSNINIPKEIEFFSLNYLNKYSNILIKKDLIKDKNFLHIGRLLKQIIDLKTFFIKQTILELEKKIILEKKQKLLFTNNDIFELIKNLFLSNKLFINKFSNKYSIVLIDEFQDLNINLTNIFYYLYILPKKRIILLCDNKQSIFNLIDNSLYLTIKKNITNIFYIKINWRSSSKLIFNINWLFSNIKNAFLFKNIIYLKNYYLKSNKNIIFKINGIEQKAFTFWYYTDNNNKGITSNVYKNVMAKQCAYQIKNWLFLISKNKAQLFYKKKQKYLTIQDIVIIVKNKIEADLMKKELDILNIDSFYTSYKQNIFKSLEAYELLNLLKFIYYNNTQTNKYIDSNNILYINIKLLNKNHKTLLEVIEFYKNLWKKYGLLCMLNNFCKKEKIICNLLHQKNIKNILYNILYLGEILQNKSFNNPEPAYILRWLENQINNNFYEQSKTNLLFKPKNVITILSIHQSKGLQFPIVCLPFISDFKINNSKIFFNKKNKNFVLNLENTKKKINEKDRLSKDLRLLYVALTRAIFHCSLGISPIVKTRKLKFTDFHKNSLGYLLQKKKIFSVENTNLLIEKISKEKKNTISIVWLKNNILYKNYNLDLKYENFYKIDKNFLFTLNINDIHKNKNSYLCKTKYINSFTGLIKSKYKTEYTKNLFFIDNLLFPKGFNIGKFLHKILEQINFVSKINKIWLKEQLIIYGYQNKLLLNFLYNWLKKICIYPFNINGLSLSKISCKKQLREFQFFISIPKKIKIKKINLLFEKYINKKIIFEENLILKDVFTGIIDMLFFWKGKYYILDFKTHYLGDKKENYKINSLENVIFNKYYWIQYYFYTLAIHRYLIKRDNKYDYKKQFGGVYYFFIQTVNYINKYSFENLINKYGIFYDYPNYQLIKKLNDLFKI